MKLIVLRELVRFYEMNDQKNGTNHDIGAVSIVLELLRTLAARSEEETLNEEDVVRFIDIINDPNNFAFFKFIDPSVLNNLLQETSETNQSYIKFIHKLKTLNIENTALSIFVLKHPDYLHLVSDILDFLEKHCLVSELEINENSFIAPKATLQTLKILEDAKLCSREIVEKYLKLDHLQKKKYLNRILNHLHETQIELDESLLHKLFSLSIKNLKRVAVVTAGLASTHLLNQGSFAKALVRISNKLPRVSPDNYKKLSRKVTGKLRSELELNNSLIHLYVDSDSKEYKSGANGTIKKGYTTEQENTPVFCVKTLREHGRGMRTDLINHHKVDIQKEATHEVQYNKIFEDDQATFINHKNLPRLILPWRFKKPLNEYIEQNKIQKFSIKDRLAMLGSGLSRLAKLHERYRVHGDIKLKNIVIHPKKNQMYLIDFGSAHKAGFAKFYPTTPAFLNCEKNLHASDFSKDMYAMGIVAGCMFKEICEVYFTYYKTTVNIRSECLTNMASLDSYQQAAIYLINAMLDDTPAFRCTAAQAAEFCDQVIKQPELKTDDLLSIVERTIKQPPETEEDVLLGRIAAVN